MSAENILVWIVIGGIAGILAEALVGGFRSGLIGAIVVGILGRHNRWMAVRRAWHKHWRRHRR